MSQAADPRLVPLRDSLAGKVLRGTNGVAYHLRECIGEGGQGWVFLANWDDPTGMMVIVKVLRPDVVGTEALRRFQQEANVLRRISTERPNPYVVRFFDHAVAQVPSPYGPEPLTLPFTVLEYVHGPTLEKVLADNKNRGLPVDRSRRLLSQIAKALDVVHAQKIVHRDLKPSNILLAQQDNSSELAKVTDFGLVKLVDMNLQKTAALAGASLGYAPPEQYEQGNSRVSPKTDIFSLAAVAYEMFSGKPAFPFHEGENPLLIVTRILNGARPSLMKTRNTLAPELETKTEIIQAIDQELQRAMAAELGARHDSVMAFFQAIEKPMLAALGGEKSRSGGQFVSPYEATHRQNQDGAASSGSGVQVRMPGSAPPQQQQSPIASTAKAGEPVQRPSRQPDRASEAHASSPAAWTWTVLTTPLGASAIRAASFSPTGEAAIAIGSSGMLRWERGAWIPMKLAPQIPAASVRGIRWIPSGALIFGEGGLVARVTPSGHVLLRVPDAEIVFHGGIAEDNGTTTLVGERPYRGAAARSVPGTGAGVVTQFNGDRVTVVGDAINCTRLRAVTRLAGGQLVACGDWGAVVRIEMGVVEHVGSICGGHLLAIASTSEGGAVTVGVGGHALSLSPKLDAQLEAVQTTQNLLSISTTDDGQAWAGSVNARLLRRSNGSWVRMSGDIGVSSSMIAVQAQSRTVRAIGDDGAVVEGRIA